MNIFKKVLVCAGIVLAVYLLQEFTPDLFAWIKFLLLI